MPRQESERYVRPLKCKCGNVGIGEYEETADPAASETRLVTVTGDFKAKIGSNEPITCEVCGAQLGIC